MKSTLTLLTCIFFSTILMAQTEVLSNAPFEREWQHIDSLLQQQLPESAKTAVLALADQAAAAAENDHVLKTKLYLAELRAELEEEGDWAGLQDLSNEFSSSSGSQRAVLASILAQAYYSYAQQNQWQLRDRTPSTETPTAEEATWTLSDFYRTATDLFLQSLAEEATRNTQWTEYSALLIPGAEASKSLRPTLYDILLHRALDYFRSNDALVGDPAYQTTLTDMALLDPPTEFVSYRWPSNAPQSRMEQLLRLLQSALEWRLEQNNRPALLDLDLIRLRYVYEYLQNEAKEEAYRMALIRWVALTEGTESQAMPLLALARWHYQQGQQYEPGQEQLRWKFKTSIKILERIASKFPDSFEAREAKALRSQLEYPSLRVEIEAVHLPQDAGLVSITYQNLEEIHLRLVKLTEAEYLFEQGGDDWLAKLTQKPAVRSWPLELPQAGDYRSHRTETSFPGLARGVYALLVSTRADFRPEQTFTASAAFWVSELGLLHQQDYEEGNEFMVVNRRSGQPVAEATLEIWTKEGREDQRKKRLATYQTDADGQVQKVDGYRSRVFVGVAKDQDRLYSLDGNYLRTGTRPPWANPLQLQYFLDRAIYRPGQTVYFKGLLTQQQGTEAYPQIVSEQTVTVALYDANRQKVSELELTSNAWGSVHGQFTLPQGGLLGHMRLDSEYGGTSFRVEAYKRPRFQATLDDLAEAAQLGDTVTVTGKAQAYAGPAIANATAVYSVSRQVLYPWFYWRGPSRTSDVTVASGTLKSDENGHFQFDFPALAPAEVAGAARYRFKIQVDVTDEAGETRSASKVLELADFPLDLSLKVPQQVDLAEGLSCQIESKNLDGQPVAAVVQLRIYQLNSPEMVPIERYWPLPDTLLLGEKAFRRSFPYLEYGTAMAKAEEPAGEPIWEEERTIEGAAELAVAISDWPVGQYLVELATVSPRGDTLRRRQTLAINDWTSGRFGPQSILHTRVPQHEYQPGETLSFDIGTAAQNVGVYVERLNQKGKLQRQWVYPKNRTAFSYPLTEAERGTVLYSLQYFYRNRIQRQEMRFAVPWTNKRLQLRTETFRSTLRPGTAESWRLRILNPQDEGTEAELLASMYDASLDQFVDHRWQFAPEPGLTYRRYWWARGYEQEQCQPWMDVARYYNDQGQSYPRLLDLELRSVRNMPIVAYSMAMDGAANARSQMEPAPPAMAKAESVGDLAAAAPEDAPSTEAPPEAEASTPPLLRTNLQETAFFFPELYAAADGSIELAFTSPEALTSWKLQLLAHNQDLAYALRTEEVVTQKELMILPNFPRFVRTGDRIRLAAKVSNLSADSLAATATLELFDLATEQSLDPWLLTSANDALDLAAGASAGAYWEVRVPADFTGALGYRVYVRSASFSDGEEGFWPVLSNQVLVTESQPIFVSGGEKASFSLERLAQSKADRRHHQLSFDMVANPVWEAIKALPYLQEYPYDCTEQLMNRWFANSLALHIASQEPRLEAYYEAWAKDSTALQSPLAQNDGSKTALLTETPWVQDALAESEQRRQIRKLFDRTARKAEQQSDWQQIVQRQAADGSFSWFPGGPGNTYITQYVVEQFARLRQLTNNPQLNTDFVRQALNYLDQAMAKRYRDLAKRDRLGDDHFGPTVAQYLYVRSHFPDIQLVLEQQVYDYWLQQAIDHWTQQGLQTQAYAAIALQRQKRENIAANIFQSLRERSRYQEDLGRYWPARGGWYWYEHPLETHCILMEAYRELGGSTQEQDELRLWLLRNKETNRWETTKATAAAIYALLHDGSSWQEDDKPLRIRFPRSKSATAVVTQAQSSAEAGTGYFRINWEAPAIEPALAEVEVRNPNSVPAWGGLYWQYFSPIDEIEVAENTPLQIERQLYVRTTTDSGEELRPVQGPIAIGDQVTVRLVVRTDRDMEFVHLKDLRAAGLEPIQVLSGYRYQGGLGYYQSTTDLATHFFFDYLPRGEYVLEYDLRVFHAGDFSGGMASLQCMYAPKFAGHSAGDRLEGVAKE